MKELTYSEAIEKVMLDNNNFASLKLIYNKIWEHKDIRGIHGITPEKTIQEKVQRDQRFTRIGKGIYALTEFIEKIEKDDSGYFIITNDNEIELISNSKNTERITSQKVRIGQSSFRKKLIKEMKACPITGIDEPKLLIASHIKPWIYCNNHERLNINNGLLLSPLFDKLFDKAVGLITFTKNKEILISPKLSDRNIEKLGISRNQILDNLIIDGKEKYLEYHNNYIYQG